MFTGIVESKGRVLAIAPRKADVRRLVVTTRLPVAKLPIGASIAVNGACLTIVARRPGRFEADLGPETLTKTTLGDLRAGDTMHLERPMRLGAPIGGHLVTGHVDGVGRVASTSKRGDALALSVTVPKHLAPLLAVKGSIAIDGVSLTVNGVKGSTFSVILIPHTLAATCLGERRRADRVNIEADLVAKHVQRLLRKPRAVGRLRRPQLIATPLGRPATGRTRIRQAAGR